MHGLIEVTRLNGTLFFLNPDMITTLEPTPDTVITLTTGEKLLVRDSVESINQQFINYKRKVYASAPEIRPYTPPEEPIW